jgi:hypothetical protein
VSIQIKRHEDAPAAAPQPVGNAPAEEHGVGLIRIETIFSSSTARRDYLGVSFNGQANPTSSDIWRNHPSTDQQPDVYSGILMFKRETRAVLPSMTTLSIRTERIDPPESAQEFGAEVRDALKWLVAGREDAIRRNEQSQHYANSKGLACGANEGVACKKCGG